MGIQARARIAEAGVRLGSGAGLQGRDQSTLDVRPLLAHTRRVADPSCILRKDLSR